MCCCHRDYHRRANHRGQFYAKIAMGYLRRDQGVIIRIIG